MADDRSDTQTWLLALDSSTDQAGICLSDGLRTAELSWDARRNQTTTLLSAIDQLLTLQRVALADLAAVAVATGPGAYTSLRIALSTAKGLTYACKVPLIGIPTLDGAARPFAEPGRCTVAVLDAGRGRLAWASYGMEDGAWSRLQPPRNGVIAELVTEVERLDGPLVTGELDAGQRAALAAAGCSLPPAMLVGRRPAGLATLAWERLARGDVDDAASLTSLYLYGGPAGGSR